MRAVTISGPGGPEVLQLVDVPDPAPGSEEVKVRVRTSALNRADLLQRRGRYPAPPGVVEDIPGLEFAGEVVDRGDRVRGPRVGDRVMGLLAGGGQAEFVTIHERLCLPVPPALDWEQAAAVPEAFLTAYDALFRQGRLAPGEAVLIHSAASGVGSAAIQLVQVAGARGIALSRTPDKRQRLGRLVPGSTVLDAGADDLGDAIRLAAGSGVDLILDTIGASAWALNVELLRRRGRLVLIGLLGGNRPSVDLAPLLRKRLHVMGSVLRSRPLEEKLTLVQEFGDRIMPLLAAGRLQPVVDRCYDWEQVAEAHRRMERNENFGKIVLTIGGGR